MDNDNGFWIILVKSVDPASAPNPIGFFLAVPTLEQAKYAVQAEANWHCGDENAPLLEWMHIGDYLGERTVTPCGDEWTVWPTILTSIF